MLRKIAVILLLVCAAAAQAIGDVKPGLKPVSGRDIDMAIDKGKLKHPYLYFTEDEKAVILEKIRNNENFNNMFNQRLAEANRLLYTPVGEFPIQAKNARFEGNYLYENTLLDYTNKAYDLALVYQLTGDKKYVKKAFEFISAVCDQPSWVHGAHKFDIIYDRVWPWGAQDDHPAFGYSQWMDHVVFKVAAVYDWLYTGLEKRERDRIRGALLENAITRVRGNYEYHWWATAYRCNWCTVCHSSLGVAAIALLTEDPQLTDVVAESYNGISKTLDQIRDGGWQEGLSYMNYMVTMSQEFADVLKRVTGGKLNIHKHPRFDEAVKTLLYCQFPPGGSVHYGDSGGGRVGSYKMYNKIMLETGNRTAAWLRDYYGYSPGDLMDAFIPRSTLEPELPREPSIHFKAVDWVIMRSDFTDPEKVAIAGKSGKNDDPHHGHLDVGHIGLFWQGQEFLCDHGSAGYDKKYFDKERWDYPLASSIGHNLIQVNGERQLPCKLKNQPWNENIGGHVVEFRPGNDRDYTIFDPTNAYAQTDLKKWRRHIILEKPVITVMLDEVMSERGAEIEARFHSGVTQVLKDSYVMLNGEKGSMALIPVVEGEFTLRQGKHAILAAQKNASFRWVPYFGTVVKAQKTSTIIGTIILPVDNDSEAQEIANSVKRSTDSSGNLTISFAKDGQEYNYTYIKGKEGLVFAE